MFDFLDFEFVWCLGFGTWNFTKIVTKALAGSKSWIKSVLQVRDAGFILINDD
jgi:hypothetical protein